MDVTKIPFAEKVGVVRNSDGVLELPFNNSIHNHLQSIHACAQFTLAETSSGEMLQSLFPDLVDRAVPLLRDSTVKYKKQAQGTISAHPSVTNDSISKFKEQFAKKRRASISISVEVKDQEGMLTCACEFNWFIQSIEQLKT
jgi:acyl-coenzyme A thioesterase PaaI-like protein